MNRLAAETALWLAFMMAFSLAIGLAEVNGFFPSDQITVWSRAIIATDATEAFRATTTAYPVLPFVMLALVEPIWPDTLPPPPSILAAAVASITLLLWIRTLRHDAGYSTAMAIGLTLLLAANPLFLRAVSGGLDDALIILAFWLVVEALVGLRLSASPMHLFQLALGHVLLLYSARFGMLIAAASVPMAIAATPVLVLRKRAAGYFLVLFFPAVFALAGLSYANWVFNTATNWREAVTIGGMPVWWPYLAGVPALALVPYFMRHRHAVFWPLSCGLATLPLAMMLASANRLPLSGDIVAGPLIAGLAVMLHYWPGTAMRAWLAPALLSIGAIGGGWSLAAAAEPETAAWNAAIRGTIVDGPLLDNRIVTAFLRDRDDIMLDAESHPDLVVALGNADGLVLAGAERFDLAFVTDALIARHVVVRPSLPGADPARDIIVQRFPALAFDVVPNYRLVLENAGWRVFERRDVDTSLGKAAQRQQRAANWPPPSYHTNPEKPLWPRPVGTPSVLQAAKSSPASEIPARRPDIP